MESDEAKQDRRTASAPWWVYVGAIVAANYGRQQVVDPDDVSTVVNIALFAGVTAVVFAAVWFGHRLLTSR